MRRLLLIIGLSAVGLVGAHQVCIGVFDAAGHDVSPCKGCRTRQTENETAHNEYFADPLHGCTPYLGKMFNDSLANAIRSTGTETSLSRSESLAHPDVHACMYERGGHTLFP